MTNIDEFNHRECDKIDANKINAYVDFHLDELNPTGLCIETSWGGDCLDLESIVKAGETVTNLELSPAGDPTCLVFNREDGQADCIHGDDLSRIISLTKLKDVDQGSSFSNGDVLMYRDGKWYPFDLQTFVDNTNTNISNLNAALTQLRNRIQQILDRWALPDGVPDNAKIMLGNINLYSDTNAVINSAGIVQSLNKNNGIYGHDLTTNRAQDEIFG